MNWNCDCDCGTTISCEKCAGFYKQVGFNIRSFDKNKLYYRGYFSNQEAKKIIDPLWLVGAWFGSIVGIIGYHYINGS
jgi:hypothetical protein